MTRALLTLILLAAASPALAQTPCTPNNPLAPAAGVTCKQDGQPVKPSPTAGVAGAVHAKLQDLRTAKADRLIAAHKCAEAKTYAAAERSLPLTQHVDKACLPAEK